MVCLHAFNRFGGLTRACMVPLLSRWMERWITSGRSDCLLKETPNAARVLFFV